MHGFEDWSEEDLTGYPFGFQTNANPPSQDGATYAANDDALKGGANAGATQYREIVPQGNAIPSTGAVVTEQLILNRSAPMNSASTFVLQQCMIGDVSRLRYWRGSFYFWNGSCYRSVDKDNLRGAIWHFLHMAYVIAVKDGVKFPTPFNPKPSDVNALIDALAAVVGLNSNQDAPQWLKDADRAGLTKNYIAFKNGILHLPSNTFFACNAYLFNLNATDIAYDPNAPQPERWLKFLKEVWPDDPQPAATLQEIIGYLLSSDTSLQKIFMLIGAARGGKGTILRVIQALIGLGWTAMTLAQYADKLEFENSIDKSVIFTPDAAIDPRKDVITAVERIKSISGEDVISVGRKFKPAYVGRLTARIVISSNELLRLFDRSGALASRVILLQFTKSFLGKRRPRAVRPEASSRITGYPELGSGRFEAPD